MSGLFRSLLHDVLQQRLDLIPEVLPDLWSEVLSSDFGCAESNFTFDSARVRSAFTRLLQFLALYNTSKFCFFIDGLDEYEETLQDDHKAMVQFLLSWTEAAPHSVKFCVSSREYNVFVNSFADDKRLRLQDLTIGDMRHYVRDKLRVLEPEALDRLVHTITAKADGIFLWVALVVKSIRTRLEDGYGLSMIEEEVNSLPDELEGLFQHLVDSIRKPYQKRAYQTFAILELLRTATDSLHVKISFSLLAYGFLDEYNADEEFAQKSHPLFANISATARHGHEEAARKRLNAQCQGLTETDRKNHIIYTHRSVPEFLAKYLHRMHRSILAEFDPTRAISQLLLADIRVRPNDGYWMDDSDDDSFARVTELLQGLMALRQMKNMDSPPFAFFEALGRAADSTVSMKAEGPSSDTSPCYSMRVQSVLASNPKSILYAATCRGIETYVDWRIATEPCFFDNQERLADLITLAFINGVWLGGRHPEMNPLSILSVLFRRGLSPQSVIFNHSAAVKVGGMSVWEYVIFMTVWLAFQISDFERWTTQVGKAIQEALEHGANTELLSVELVKGEQNSGECRRVTQNNITYRLLQQVK